MATYAVFNNRTGNAPNSVLSIQLAPDGKLSLQEGSALVKVDAGSNADRGEKSLCALQQVGAELVTSKYLDVVGEKGAVRTDIIDYGLLDSIAGFIYSFAHANLEKISEAIAEDDKFWSYRKNLIIVKRELIYMLAYRAARPLIPSLGNSDSSNIYLIHRLRSKMASAPIRDTEFSIDEYVELCHYYFDYYSLYLRKGFRDTEFEPDLNRIFCLRLFEKLYGNVSEFHSVIPYTWFIYPCILDVVDQFYTKLREDLSTQEEDNEN